MAKSVLILTTTRRSSSLNQTKVGFFSLNLPSKPVGTRTLTAANLPASVLTCSCLTTVVTTVETFRPDSTWKVWVAPSGSGSVRSRKTSATKSSVPSGTSIS